MGEEVKNFGRLNYFEPLNVVSKNNEGSRSDSITFPYEDYNIAVDLDVSVCDRYSCGFSKESNQKKNYHFSTTGGTLSFLGGTNGFLTTNFTDIQNINPTQNTNECLGIESIVITYDSWLHPTVVIKFVDIRGATVMQPSEQNYYNEGGQGSAYYLYKSLFTMPYPMFKLKVKGFYGRGVTYRLAVNKADIDFDANNGNFVITVNFIGHIYGMFADMPMSFISIAPYTREGEKYWNEKIESPNREFWFYDYDSEGNEVARCPMIRFPELALLISQIEEKQPYSNSEAESGIMLEKYDNEISQLNSIISSYNSVFGNKDIYYEDNFYSYILVQGLNNNKAIDNITNNLNLFIGAINGYDETHLEKLQGKFPGVGKFLTKDGKLINPFRYNYSGNSISLDQSFNYTYPASETTRNANRLPSDVCAFIKDKNPNKGNSNKVTVTGFLLYMVDKGGSEIKYDESIKNIEEMKKNKEKEKDEKVNSYKEEKEKMISESLGFTPSIKNIFDLVFAHLETFIHVFYSHLGKIRDQLLLDPEKRLKTTYSISDGYTDTEFSNGNTSMRCNYLPPFATFYKDVSEDNDSGENGGNKKRKQEIWPGELENGNPTKNLEEVKFVYELLNGSKLYYDTFNEDNYFDKNELSPSIKTIDFIPVTLFDISNNGKYKNPYESIAEKLHSDANIEEVFYDLCAIYSLRMYYYCISTQCDEKGAKAFGNIEAVNFLKAVGADYSNGFVNFIKTYVNKKTDSNQFIKSITSERDSWTIKNSVTTNGELFRFTNGSNLALMYSYSKKIKSGIVDFRYFPLYVSGTKELKDDFTKTGLNLTGRYISTINHEYFHENDDYGDYDFDIKIGETSPGGTFLLWENIKWIDELFINIKNELVREKDVSESEETKTLCEQVLNDYELDDGEKTFKRFNKNYLLSTDDTSIYQIDKMEIKNKIDDSVVTLSDYLTLIKNPEFENLVNDLYILNPTDIFEHPLYRIQNDVFVKAYLFIQSIFFRNGDGNSNLGIKTSTNTIIEKFSLLKEGSYYWWINNYDNIYFVDEGFYKEKKYSYKKPSSAETFYRIYSQTNNGTLGIFMPIEKEDGSGARYYHIPDVLVGEHYQTPKNSEIKDFENISESRKIYLKNYFETWVYNDFRTIVEDLENEKIRIDGQYNMAILNDRTTEKESIAAYNVQKFLRDLIFTYCTVIDYYGGFYRQNKKIVVPTSYFESGFKSFFNQLYNIYEPIINANRDSYAIESLEYETEECPFESEDLKLSAYMTLKSLYNKWLCGSLNGEDSWKLNRFGYDGRKSRVKYGSEDNSGLYEFDNFIYMDSFYRDIGYNLKVNIIKVMEWIKNYCIPSSPFNNHESIVNYNSKTIYEFLTQIAQDCGGILIAIPQKFMYDNKEDIKTVFTPISSLDDWDDNSYTYMFLYNYKPSEHLGDTDGNNIDMNGWSPDGDGFSLTDNEITGNLFDINDNGYGVPSFGVTFGKQNQSYFKDIKLSTSQYGVTEASLNATFQIASKSSETIRQTTLYGQDIYKVYANNAYQCTVEMMGDMQIFPPMYFQLNNIPLWKGAYIITKVTHTITPGDATTTIVGVRQNKNLIPFSDCNIVSYISDKKEHLNGTNQSGTTILTSYNIGSGYRAQVVRDLGFSSHPTQEECRSKMVTISIEAYPDRKITVHQDLVEEVQSIFKELKNAGVMLNEYIGGYCFRAINNPNHPNSKTLSMHSFGCAIDINYNLNPFVRHGTPMESGDDTPRGICRTSSSPIVKAFEMYGWGWGGRYGDYMHFSKANGG